MDNSQPKPPRAFLQNATDLIAEVDDLFTQLFPICRSLTGSGVRETLSLLNSVSDFSIKEIASGSTVFDWTIPDEWEIEDAYIATSDGTRIISFRDSNIHVVNFSAPVNAVMTFDELEPHLHSLPDLPTAIPYRTTYYKRDWGFCLTHDQLQAMDKTVPYTVVIKASHKPGVLNYGEALLPGTSKQEYLISTYCCHPSLANDNLSGGILWILLLRWLKSCERHHSYRFVIAPETIGAITYLSENPEAMRKIAGGYVLSTVAGPGNFGYSHSFKHDHIIDRAAKRALTEFDINYISYPFDITGSDERQYSTPSFRIPVGTISKSKYFEYDYYHTSLDNLDYVKPEYLIDSLALYMSAIMNLEHNRTYRSLNPSGEPMLGKRNLYPSMGGNQKQKVAYRGSEYKDSVYAISDGVATRGDDIEIMLWLMFHGDGETSILDIAEQIDMPVAQIFEKAELLCREGLLEPVA